MPIGPEEFKALLAEELDPQTFVRRGLGLLESQFRAIALLSLADWQECGIYSADLFGAIASLQRPSWGHWNGLMSALRNARKQVLRSHGPEERQKLDQASRLKRALELLEEPIPPDLVGQLQPLAQLLNQKLRARHRMGQILTLPIAMRNRIAHDVPNDADWWQSAEQGLRYLLSFHARRALCDEIRGEEPYPAPWFITHVAGDEPPEAEPNAPTTTDREQSLSPTPREDVSETTDDAESGVEVWAFNGLDQHFSVLYVHPRKRTRHRKDATRPMLLAFQQLLGRADAYEGDFKKLLSKLAPEDLKGVIMGDFLVGRPVGSGGFATVHIGRQLSTGREVAIKILHDGMDEEIAERFRQEARYLSQFRHPHIVGVISYGEETWRAPRQRELVRSLKEESWYQRFSKSAPVKTYIALEWVEGHTLEAIYQGLHRDTPPQDPRATTAGTTPWKAPDLRQLATWYAQAANALNAVHALGLIHRDVKPANLMVNDKGQLKLMDFGIARSQDENRTLITTFGQGIGTPAYMSPEQIKARHGDATLGPNTDIYSLSATFYELFTGRRLYYHDLETMESVQTKKLGGELPLPPRAAVEGLPWEIETILMGGLQAEISDRYSSMEALEQDLRRFLADEPITYKRPSIWRQLQLNYRRHSIVYQLVALFVMLVGGGGLAHVRQLQKEQDKTARARWLAVKRYKQAEIEKRRALHNERIAQRASDSARRLALLALKRARQAKEAQRATMREKQKVERQRKKLLAIQKRFLLERMSMIKLSTLKQSAAETVLRFFQEVLDERANPIGHHELALRGISALLHQEKMGQRADTVLDADLTNALFAGLLRYVLHPTKQRKRLRNRRKAAWCTAMLAPYIDQDAQRLQPLLRRLMRHPRYVRAWQQVQARQPRWLTAAARLLGAGLQDPDTQIKMAMVGSLLRLGYSDAFQLRKYMFPLSRWRPHVSHEMFMMLISAPQIEALSPLPMALLEELGDSPSIDVRRKALRLLAAKGPAGVPALLGGLSDNSWSLRTEARKLIAAIGAPAVPHIYKALGEQDRSTRYYSFLLLRQIGKPALTALFKALTHRARSSTYRAFYSIKAIVRRTRQPLPFALLKPLLQHQRKEVRSYSLRLLDAVAKAERQANIGTFWKMAQDPEENTKIAALNALCKLDLSRHQKRLQRFLKSQKWDKGEYQWRTLRYQLLAKDKTHCSQLTLMLKGLKDSSSNVRQAARETLATCGEVALSSLSRQLFKPGDWVTRREAARTLGQMKPPPPKLLSLLEKALKDHDDNVRYAVVLALGNAGSKGLPIMARTLHDPSQQVRQALVKGLAKQGPTATLLLQKLLLDPSSAIRNGALRALKYNLPPQHLDLSLLRKAYPRMGWQLRSYLGAIFGKTQNRVLLQLIGANELPTWLRIQALKALMYRRDAESKQQGLLRGLRSRHATLRAISAKHAVRQQPTLLLAKALRKALHDKNENVRKAALPCLTWPQLKTRRVRLFRKALMDPYRYIRREALNMLGKYRSDATVLRLLALLRDDSYGWNQYYMANQLRNYAKAKTTPALKKKAMKLLQHVVFHGRSASARKKALRVAMSFGLLAIPTLKQAIAEPAMRSDALDAAYSLTRGIMLLRAEIKQSFNSQNPKNRAAAARLVGLLGRHAGGLLPRALRHKLYQVRRNALDGLRRTKYWSDALLPLVAERLKDPRKWARRRAAYALHQAGVKAVPLLKQALQDQSNYVQNAAIYTFTRLGLPTETLVMHLRYALSNAMPSSRGYARTKLMSELERHPKHALYLLGMLPSVDLQQKALRELTRAGDATNSESTLGLARMLYPTSHPLGLLPAGAPAAFHAWWAQQHQRQTARRHLARLLGRTCRPESVAHLRRALRRDDAPQVRGQAALSLGKLGPLARAALPDIKGALRDPAPQVRAAAAYALRRLQRTQQTPEDPVDQDRNDRCFRTAQAVLFGHVNQ